MPSILLTFSMHEKARREKSSPSGDGLLLHKSLGRMGRCNAALRNEDAKQGGHGEDVSPSRDSQKILVAHGKSRSPKRKDLATV
jgi:hypothetical protein